MRGFHFHLSRWTRKRLRRSCENSVAVPLNVRSGEKVYVHVGAKREKGKVMNPQRRLVLASVIFAVLWTLGMVWWAGVDAVNIIGFSISGAVAGVLWYFAMR
jgi:hypothetical protein